MRPGAVSTGYVGHCQQYPQYPQIAEQSGRAVLDDPPRYARNHTLLDGLVGVGSILGRGFYDHDLLVYSFSSRSLWL